MDQALPTTIMPWAIVEIPGEFDPNMRRDLIEAAYRSSVRGVVGLVLRGLSRQSADHLLNEVVSAHGNEKGVVYLVDEERMLAAASRARFVVAATSGFRSRLVAHGISPIEPAEADAFLRASASLAPTPLPA